MVGSSITTTSTKGLLPTPTNSQIRKLSPADLQARRENGLCYYCDERFTLGHRCQKRFHLLVTTPEFRPVDDELTKLLNYFEQDENPESDPKPSLDPPDAQINIHSLMGHTTPQTLRVQGVIGKSPMVILVDSGSTHNVMQDKVAKFLGLHVQATHSFSVMVGNGEEIRCDSYCPNVGIKIDCHRF